MDSLPDHIDPKVRYIICPNMTCKGWYEDQLRCIKSNWYNESTPICPHLKTAKTIVFCYYGHPIMLGVNHSSFLRVDCTHPNCGSLTFSLLSNRFYRIPLELLDEFLKLNIKP